MKKPGKHPITIIELATCRVLRGESVICSKDASENFIKEILTTHINFWMNSDDIQSITFTEELEDFESNLVAYVVTKGGKEYVIGINFEIED